MATAEALRLLVSLGLLLLVLRPITGIIVDVFKVMLILGTTGLVLQIIPLNFIDEWSRDATGWLRVTAVYVPIVALLAIVALSNVNVVALSGTAFEQVIKIFAYIVGGVFTVGSVEWIAWGRSVGDVVSGVVGVFTNALLIIASVLTP